MRLGGKIALVVAALAAFAAIRLWQERRLESAETLAAARSDAIEAMKQLTAESTSLEAEYCRATAELTTQVALGSKRGTDTLQSRILPMLDRHIAISDRALQLADAYLALEPAADESIQRHLDKIRKQTAALRTMRGKLDQARAGLERGASSDEIASLLAAAGWELMLSALPPE